MSLFWLSILLAFSLSETSGTAGPARNTQTRRELPVAQAGGSSAAATALQDELLAARDAAWRAFFSKDPRAVEQALGPELIAIQESQELWESRDHLIAIAKYLREHNVTLVRLEFPHTEIQVFGSTAILYYTYIFETATNGVSTGTDAGRGTEVFILRDGKWVDVGWHLDNGPFYRKEGSWVRAGSYPDPGPVRTGPPKN
jgi:hypothetical protein